MSEFPQKDSEVNTNLTNAPKVISDVNFQLKLFRKFVTKIRTARVRKSYFEKSI